MRRLFKFFLWISSTEGKQILASRIKRDKQMNKLVKPHGNVGSDMCYLTTIFKNKNNKFIEVSIGERGL